MIIAAPDGSIEGRPSMFQAGSFYINSKAGRFEDYIIQDVWGAVTKHFKVRPEREAHLLTGSSMGGFGAFNLGIKHRDQFAIVAGIHPPLNLRYQDCRGRYFSDYDPTCVSYREDYRPFAPVARFYGIITVRQRQLAAPLFDQKSDVMAMIAKENPIEMLDSYRVKPGELSLFAGYGGRDQFNIDAQIESFVDAATARGITIKTVKDPRGDHSTETGLKLFPYFCYWVAPLLKDYPPIPIK
jgi:S-formylglutathione hydrolase FrmB